MNTILEALRNIKDDLGELREAINELEKRQRDVERGLHDVSDQVDRQFRNVSTDLRTVHALQQSFMGRLSFVEEGYVSQPLRSIPAPTPIPDEDEP